MTVSFARVSTRHAAEYLTTLSAEWRRKIPVVFHDDAHVVVPSRFGMCEFEAGDDFLEVTITGRSISDVSLLEEIVSEHIDGAASDEELRYQWIITPTA